MNNQRQLIARDSSEEKTYESVWLLSWGPLVSARLKQNWNRTETKTKKTAERFHGCFSFSVLFQMCGGWN